MLSQIIQTLVTIGFLAWLGHITLMLYSDLQEEKKSTTEAGKLWIKMLATIILVAGLIFNT